MFYIRLFLGIGSSLSICEELCWKKKLLVLYSIFDFFMFTNNITCNWAIGLGNLWH